MATPRLTEDRFHLIARALGEKGITSQTPLGRIGQPSDISPTAVYLASSDSKYMTGQTLNISSGIR